MAKARKSQQGTSYTKPLIAMKVAELLTQGLSPEAIKWELLGGRQFSTHIPTTALEFHDAVLNGVPKLSIDILAEVMQIPMTTMANLLNMSYKTLTRKNKTDLLDPMVSSHTSEISDTIVKGFEVFEDGGRLNKWLNKENRALKGRKPFDLMYTPTGIKLVNQVLGRLEEGIYS